MSRQHEQQQKGTALESHNESPTNLEPPAHEMDPRVSKFIEQQLKLMLI